MDIRYCNVVVAAVPVHTEQLVRGLTVTTLAIIYQSGTVEFKYLAYNDDGVLTFTEENKL